MMRKRPGRFTILEGLVIVAIIAVGLALIGCGVPFQIAYSLLLGWAFFLGRVAPQIAMNWGGVFTAIVCLVALALGMQWLMGWFYKQVQKQKGNATPQDWSWKWTLRLLGLVVIMFVAGISAIGITHQTGWLITSPEPLMENDSRVLVDRIRSANNLHQIGLACHNYHDQHKTLPPGGTFDAHGAMLHGWQTLLLPYIEQPFLYERIDLKKPWNHPDNAPVFQTKIRVYLHPTIQEEHDGEGFALTQYAGNARLLGGDVPWKFADITDGTSNTIMAGEAAGNFKPWGYPVNWRDPALGLNKTPDGFGGPSPRGTNFLFADGSVHNVKNDIDPSVLKALSTPNGGEVIDSDDW